MTIKKRMIQCANTLLRPLDARIVRASRPPVFGPSGSQPDELISWPCNAPSPVPADLVDVLRLNHPRLGELRSRYRALDTPATAASMWTEEFQQQTIDIRHFRGDNAYLWQYRGTRSREQAELRHLLTAYYVRTIDRYGLLDVLREDDLFGIHTFELDEGCLVSRDLLDSIVEICFLERSLGILARAHFNILDVGAGYGRLAHRMARALPGLERYFCVDGIALSTFLSEVYLRFRGVDDKATVVALDELEQTLDACSIDLAVNVHSFSECPLTTIDWWLAVLQRHRVSYLMIVPNDSPQLLSRERDGRHLDFLPLVEAHGYRLVTMQPKYLDRCIQEYGIHPTYHYLFALAS
jgi:SAM-dependent methyltransferase